MPLNVPSLLSLADGTLLRMLWRKDLNLRELRNQIIDHHDEYGREKWAAAVRADFSMTDEQFYSVLKEPEGKRNKLLEDLDHADDLPSHVLDAIGDYLGISSPSTFLDDPSWYRSLAREHLRDRLNELKEDPPYDSYEEALLRLRLYRMARSYVPVDKKREGSSPPTGALEFLHNHIIEGDTWATFMAFYAAWQTKVSVPGAAGSYDLERYLPRISELGEIITSDVERELEGLRDITGIELADEELGLVENMLLRIAPSLGIEDMWAHINVSSPATMSDNTKTSRPLTKLIPYAAILVVAMAKKLTSIDVYAINSSIRTQRYLLCATLIVLIFIVFGRVF
jgi:hypothetical protein